MQFNEFKRRLNDAHLSPQAEYLLTHMFEVQVQFSKDMNTQSSLILELANAVGKFIQLNQAMEDKMRQVLGLGKEDGIDVQSVANDPEQEH
jgi:hypothetical protein